MNKKEKLELYVVVLMLMLCSCSKKEHIEYEYYEDGKTLMEICIYPNYPNDSCFINKVFYRNGSLFTEGNFVNYNQDGEWKYWFRDGTPKMSIFFNNGIPDYAHPNRKLPENIPLDSFRVGTKTRVRVTNLYPEQNLIIQGNINIEEVDEYNYNHEITTLFGDSASFYYDILTRVDIDSSCFKQLQKKRVLPKYDKTFIYKRTTLKLVTFKIYE